MRHNELVKCCNTGSAGQKGIWLTVILEMLGIYERILLLLLALQMWLAMGTVINFQ